MNDMVYLRQYQKGMLTEMVKRNVLIDAPCGSGKTLATLCAIMTMLARGEGKRVLIIAPKHVARNVWVQEANKYNLPLNIKFNERQADLKLFLFSAGDHWVSVCSVTRIDEIMHGCWDVVIFDESTLYGEVGSNRSKQARRLTSRVRRVILLTGTGVHGGYHKLFHQMMLLDGGKTLGRKVTSFRDTYMTSFNIAGVTTVYKMKPEMIIPLLDACRHLIYHVHAEIPLPPLFEKNVVLTMPRKAMDAYKEFEIECIIEFPDAFKPNGTYSQIYAACASAKGMKLRQFASGCIYKDVEEGQKREHIVLHSAKIEAVKEISECTERGILVAYLFASELEELSKIKGAREIKNEQDIIDWNNGDIKIGLIQPQGKAWGLNLQFGGSTIVWYSLMYDAEIYSQLNARLYRSGQKYPVTLTHLIMEGTIDEKILTRVKQKVKDAENFRLL